MASVSHPTSHATPLAMSSRSLPAVLEDIQNSNIPAGAKKSLLRQAVAFQFGMGVQASAAEASTCDAGTMESTTIDALEHALHAVHMAAAMPSKPTVSAAKVWLRAQGSNGAAIASRDGKLSNCLLYTSPSPRDRSLSRMPSSA